LSRGALAYFPYRLRDGQSEFLSYLMEKARDGNVVVEAPTGFGKTPLILAALLQQARREGRQIIWAVRTGTETDRPIEELKAICRSSGVRVFGISFRGKRDMCLLLRDLRIRGELDHEDVSFICRTHRDCRYRLNLSRLTPKILEGEFSRSPRLYSETLRYCEEWGVCPYMLQSLLLPQADVVALNYNYIIDERIGWAMRRLISYRDAYLVVDEAHNLQKACSNLNSDQVTLGTLRYAVRELHAIRPEGSGGEEEFLRMMHEYFMKILRGMKKMDEVELDIEACIEHCAGDRDTFGQMAQRLRRLGAEVRRMRVLEGKAPRSSLYRLGEFWSSALRNIGVDGVAFLASLENRQNLVVEMWDMRSSEVLRDVWGRFHRCIFCSGTIRPIKAFAEVIGLDEYSGRVFPSQFDEGNSISLITEDLTSEGEELEEEMAKAYVSAIERFIGSLDTNLAVFSASYRIQEALFDHGLEEAVRRSGRRLFVERQGMSGRLSRKILDEFKSCADGGERGVLCATMTGRYAEGADFPGRELEGIFLVGVPFDRMTTRTRLYLEYYKGVYGERKGTFYGYILPAIRRASQALGRALRSKEDRAVFILGDRRYKQFLNLLPDYVKRNFKIIKNNENEININIRNFWEKTHSHIEEI
jgi:DNA excision repair protein ERCC-2